MLYMSTLLSSSLYAILRLSKTTSFQKILIVKPYYIQKKNLLDSDVVASVDHGDELVPVPGPGLQLVGHRLISENVDFC